MSERWRCFVAVPIGDSLRRDLAGVVDGWRSRPELEGLRWTDPESWHVTLAFLGSVDAAETSRLGALIEDVAAQNEPMQLRTGDLGAFPSAGRARVLWYGIADPDGSLAALSADLHAALGMEVAAPHRPHVTLARAGRQTLSLRTWLEHASAPAGELAVHRLELKRSHLGRGPARYETLASASMGATGHV